MPNPTTNKYSIAKLAWFPDKLAALEEKRVTAPIYVRIKPTNRCPDACSWCIYGHGDAYNGVMHDAVDLRDVMPTEKVVEVIDDLADIGTRCVTYSGGGEPLSHPGIASIMRRTVSNGLDLSIITNGMLLDGDRAEALIPAKWVRVSIDYWDGKSRVASRGGKESTFARVDANMRAFRRVCQGELTVNFIITKFNHERIMDATLWLRDVGVDNVRFSPVWHDNFAEYHAPISEWTAEQLRGAKALATDDFKVYTSYTIDPDAGVRKFDRCCFQEIVPVVGADQCVYRCHNTAYTDTGLIGSIKGRRFRDLWFSDEARERIRSHNAKRDCSGIQCAAESKNRLYEELLAARGDNFV